MNILVFLNIIRDPAGLTVNRKAQKVFVNREAHTINPSDKNALEAALKLGGKVMAVVVGDAPAEDAARLAKAMGASRAVQIRDAVLKTADAHILTQVLEKVVEHVGGADLVLLGDTVSEADTAQVGPRLAAALGRPFINHAHQITLNGTTVNVIAQVPDGFHAFEADLPAVIACAEHSNKPRYATGAHIINVYKAKDAVEVLSVADVGLNAEDLVPLVEVKGESFPPEREPGKRVEGSLDEMAHQVAELIRKA